MDFRNHAKKALELFQNRPTDPLDATKISEDLNKVDIRITNTLKAILQQTPPKSTPPTPG